MKSRVNYYGLVRDDGVEQIKNNPDITHLLESSNNDN